MANKPLEMTRIDVITIMSKIGLEYFCFGGQRWIKNIAPDILTRDLFMDTDSRIHSYLAFFVYEITDRLHIEIHQEVMTEAQGWTEVKLNVASWNKICRVVASTAEEIRNTPNKTDVVFKEDALAIIQKIGKNYFCEEGLHWLFDSYEEISQEHILESKQGTQYLSYFVHMVREHGLAMTSYNFGKPKNDGWLIHPDNFTKAMWYYICGTVWALARRLELERDTPSTE